uniref:SH2 domain-containing protein n=1 Tax=Heterorhabditis bacteriophora TaxID=37862 RepID=A0A1I7WQS9_HETBA
MLDSPIYDNPDTRGKGLVEEIWYHGMITRLMSEQMLRDDGDFLVKWKFLHNFRSISSMSDPKSSYFVYSHNVTLVTLQASLYRIGVCKIAIKYSPGQKDVSCECHFNYYYSICIIQQRPLSSISPNQSFAIPDRIPPPPAALINRPLPLPIGRTRRSSEEDYSEVDYDAMEDILDASSVSGINFSERERSVSSPSSSMSRKFQSCQNLTYRTPSPALLNKQNPITRQKPALPPRPKFKSEKSHSVPPTPSMKISSHQPMSVEEARDSAFLSSSRPTSSEYDDLPHSLNVRSDYDSLSLKDRASRQRDSGIYRCHLIQLSCILSIVSCGHSEDPFILRQWIFTASSLILSHGNVFGFVNVFNGLNCKYLQTQQSMWDSLDIQSKIEFENLKGIYISLKNGSGLKNNNIITIPFLQPILEILSGFESQYLDETSYSTEIGGFIVVAFFDVLYFHYLKSGFRFCMAMVRQRPELDGSS